MKERRHDDQLLDGNEWSQRCFRPLPEITCCGVPFPSSANVKICNRVLASGETGHTVEFTRSGVNLTLHRREDTYASIASSPALFWRWERRGGATCASTRLRNKWRGTNTRDASSLIICLCPTNTLSTLFCRRKKDLLHPSVVSISVLLLVWNRNYLF